MIPAVLIQATYSAFLLVTLFGVALSFAKRRRGKSARSGIITTLIGCTALTILILAAVWLPEQIPFASGPPQPTDVATWKAKYDSARQALRAAEDSRDGFKKLFNAEENGRHEAQINLSRTQEAERKALAAVAELRGEITKLNEHRGRLESQLNAEVNAHRATRGLLDDAHRTIAELEVLRDRFRGEIEAEKVAHNKTLEDLLNARQRIQDLERQALPGSHVPPPDNPATLSELKANLERGLFTERYEIKPHPDRQMIVGREASYYAITITTTDPANAAPRPLEFEEAQHTLVGGDAPFLEAFDHLFRDVITKIDGRVACELFIRGDADDRAFKVSRPASDYEEFRLIRYLPREQGSASRYLDSPKSQLLETHLLNAHLPNVRAAHLVRLIRERVVHLAPTVTCVEPMILEAVPRGSQRALIPQLFLAVKW